MLVLRIRTYLHMYTMNNDICDINNEKSLGQGVRKTSESCHIRSTSFFSCVMTKNSHRPYRTETNNFEIENSQGYPETELGYYVISIEKQILKNM